MRAFFKLLLIILAFSFLNSGRLVAVDASLEITLRPISCTIDNIDIGIAKLTYLTPENCSNYYELFPAPRPQQQTTNTKPASNPSITTPLTVARKHPSAEAKQPHNNVSLYDQIQEDTITSLLVISFAAVVIWSLTVFYGNKKS